MTILRAGDLEARFEPEVSLVCTSLTHRGDELLGQRDGVEAYRERGKTMGIPLLHPWANRLGGWSYGPVQLPHDSPLVRAEEHGLPLHGLLHGRAGWSVDVAEPDRLVATLDFGARPDWLALFPYPHELRVEATLDPTGLTHVTVLRATGVAPVPVSFGWHPYLTLPGLPRAEWVVEADVAERLTLDSRQVPTGEIAFEPFADGPLGDRALDDGYRGAAGATFVLRGGGRRLSVFLQDGYTHAQVFAPTAEDVVAFEPMTAPADALRSGWDLRSVRPGEELRCAFRLDVA